MLRWLVRIISEESEKEHLQKEILEFKRQLIQDTGFEYLYHPVNRFDHYLFTVNESATRKCPHCQKDTPGVIRCRQCEGAKTHTPVYDLRSLIDKAYFLACHSNDKPAIEQWKALMPFLNDFVPPADRL